MQKNYVRGFTLIEVLAAIAIMGVLVAIVLAPFASFRNSNLLNIASEEILTILSEARGDTLSAKEGYQYGVHFESSQAVLYRGSTYSSSDPNNKVMLLDGALEISLITLNGGGADVLFDQLTGKTSQGGTVLIRVKNDITKTKTINISGTGVANVL